MARWVLLPLVLVAVLFLGAAAGPVEPALRASAASPVPLEWANLTGGPAPPAGAGTTLTYDSLANRFVWFGGWNGTTLNETWVLDPVTGAWTELAPPVAPRPRADAAFTFDPANGECYLFGGWSQLSNGSVVRLNDTWAFSLSADRWTQEFPAVAPSPRSDAGVAFDVAEGRLILFGGFSGRNYLGDGWTYDPRSDVWAPLPPAGPVPSARADGRLTYDPALGALLLFGGNNFSGPNLTFHHLADTWILTYPSGGWHLIQPPESPSARDYAVQTYDPATGWFLLYGGYGNRTILGDLWAFAPGNDSWWPIPTSDTPPPRYAGVGGFATPSGPFVLVGGLGATGLLNDTWALALPGTTGGALPPPEVAWPLYAAIAAPAALLAAVVGINGYRTRRVGRR